MANEQLSLKEIISKAGEAESKKDNNSAIELYNKAIQSDSLNVYSYGRLMKIFRALKQYKKELSVINKAIKAYENFYKKKKTKSKKVSDISEKLNRSFGLVDKKGNNLYDPEPIAGWKKRKTIVEKKLS
jgi:tetratricopeptide (TPR) repeat protein